jgi:hypothetical protein
VVVGSTTVKPGEIGTLKVSIIMHKGMGGPHLFHVFVKSSDPEKPVTVLKVKADIVPLEAWRSSHPNAFYLPRDVTGFKLRSEIVGNDVIDQSYKAFGYPGQLKYGYVGSYKKHKKETRLLVSEYTDAEEAKELFSKIIEKMKKGVQAPDQFVKKEVAGNSVYSLKKGVNERFYFQSANKVVLLFPDSSVAMQSLEEVLRHIKARAAL